MSAVPVVFIPALLCDEGLYADVIARLGDAVAPQVLISPKPSLADSAADILARAPAKFALVGTSYGGNLALEVALTAPERVAALWLMGCDPAGPTPGGPDLPAGLRASPDNVIEMLAGLVVHEDAHAARAEFKAMASRIGGEAGAAQATALSTRKEATSRLARLTMPVLALWGEADPLVPPPIGEALAKAAPHGQFQTLANCGHLPTLEKPAEAAALFTSFLRENGLIDR